MCRSHFLVAFVFVGTDFNCFLNSIRRSIPMTVAVKLTSTRRCMTCSFFVGFFVFIEREICLYARRSLCGAVRGSRRPAVLSNAPLVILFRHPFTGTHSNFEFYGWNQLRMCDEWRRCSAAHRRYRARCNTPVKGSGNGVEWIMEY